MQQTPARKEFLEHSRFCATVGIIATFSSSLGNPGTSELPPMSHMNAWKCLLFPHGNSAAGELLLVAQIQNIFFTFLCATRRPTKNQI